MSFLKEIDSFTAMHTSCTPLLYFSVTSFSLHIILSSEHDLKTVGAKNDSRDLKYFFHYKSGFG